MHNSRISSRTAPTASEFADHRRSRQSRSSAVRTSVIEDQIPMPNINALKSVFQPDGDEMHSNGSQSHKFKTSSRIHRIDTAEKLQEDVKKGKQTAVERINDKSRKCDELDLDNINHTQRFHVTRALFAKMEEQSKRDKLMAETKHIHRSKSPTRYPGTHTRLTLSPMNSNNLDTKAKNNPPKSLQLDRLNENCKQNEKFGIQLKSHVSTSSKLKDSRTTARLHPPESTRENVLENVPSPKWLMQHYEEVAKGMSSNSDMKKNLEIDKQSFHFNQNVVDKSKENYAQSKSMITSKREAISPSASELPPFVNNLDVGHHSSGDDHCSNEFHKSPASSQAFTRSSAEPPKESRIYITTASRVIGMHSPLTETPEVSANPSPSDAFPTVGRFSSSAADKLPSLYRDEDIKEKLEAWKSKRRGASESSDHVDDHKLPAYHDQEFSAENEDGELKFPSIPQDGSDVGNRAEEATIKRREQLDDIELEINKK